MPRPKKKRSDRRSEKIFVTATQAQKRLLERSAAAVNETLSTWLLNRGLEAANKADGTLKLHA